MKTQSENLLRLFSFVTVIAFVALLSACDSHTGTGPTGGKSETFTAIDEKMVLRILSRTEAELTAEGRHFVGTYTEEDGRLRVVLDIRGTQQAIYFGRTATGVRSQDGLDLYAPEEYAEVMQKVTAERRQYALNDGLLKAAGGGDVTQVRALINEGANPNVIDRDGMSPLSLAVRSGSLDSCNILIEAKANLNYQNPHGWSPLHFATEIGGSRGFRAGRDRTTDDDSIVKLLIESRAQLDPLTTRDYQIFSIGYTPLTIATERQNLNAIRLLVAAGAQRNISANGETLWQLAGSHEQTLDALRTTEERERFRRSRTETMVLATFRDWDWGGRERGRGDVRVTDVGVHVTDNVSRKSPIYYADLPRPPQKRAYKNTALGWAGYSVNLGEDLFIVFKAESERDQCFAAISQAYHEWNANFNDVR